MKNQALFSSKDKSKKLKCCLLQFLFGALKTGLLCRGWGGGGSGSQHIAMLPVQVKV